MNQILTRLPRLRDGKFKKILAPTSTLEREAPRLAHQFSLLRQQHLAPPLYAILWVIHYLRARHPHGWWGAHRRDPVTDLAIPLPLKDLPGIQWLSEETDLLERYQDVGQLLNHRAFRATPEAVHRSLLHWFHGHYPLILMDRVPTVAEVLEQQIQGKRCVTLFHLEVQLKKLVLGERDPLSFAFHDLIHADHFFHHSAYKKGQIGFYRQIHRIYHQGVLTPWLERERFQEQLEYLMADMNSHPLHLWKCFKAICHMHLESETRELFAQTLPQFLAASPLQREALIHLNHSEFSLHTEGVALTDWCEHWSEPQSL